MIFHLVENFVKFGIHQEPRILAPFKRTWARLHVYIMMLNSIWRFLFDSQNVKNIGGIINWMCFVLVWSGGRQMVKKIPPYSSFCYKRFVFEKREIGQNRWKLWHIGDIISIIISRPPIKRRLVTVDSFAVSQLKSLLFTFILTLDPPIHRRVETNSGFGSRRAQPHNHFSPAFPTLELSKSSPPAIKCWKHWGDDFEVGHTGTKKGQVGDSEPLIPHWQRRLQPGDGLGDSCRGWE